MRIISEVDLSGVEIGFLLAVGLVFASNFIIFGKRLVNFIKDIFKNFNKYYEKN